jgi:hypothetical protein
VPTGWVEVISLAADRGRPRAHWPYSLRYPRELSTTLADVCRLPGSYTESESRSGKSSAYPLAPSLQYQMVPIRGSLSI